MTRHQYTDNVYNIAKESYKKKVFTFDDLWKKLIKEYRLSADEQKKIIGIVYTDILQDKRFLYVGNKKWMLREFATVDEVNNYQSALYDFAPPVEDGYVSNAVDKLPSNETPDEIDKELDVEEDLASSELLNQKNKEEEE